MCGRCSIYEAAMTVRLCCAQRARLRRTDCDLSNYGVFHLPLADDGLRAGDSASWRVKFSSMQSWPMTEESVDACMTFTDYMFGRKA